MPLLLSFKQFIQHENLFQLKDKLLLAVSGGVDSAVLCELCKQAGYKFVIAHCNFQLRGEESERDELFVKSLGERYNVRVLVKRFETEAYARTHKCSIQVAARELRYEWFAEIVSGPFWNETSLVNSSAQGQSMHDPGSTSNTATKFIVTAHHVDDNIETMLMNLFKGTGIAGLRGMLPRQGKIVRPLLFATKEALRQFATDNKLNWVEDSSNATEKYTRNYIRHTILPLISEVYPQAESNLANNLQRFREVEYLYRQSVEQLCKKMVERKGEELHIPILKLKKTNAAGTILYELTHPLGFTPKQVAEALNLMESETGRYIASPTHRILKNRNWLIIAPVETTGTQHVLIEKGQQHVEFAGGTLILKQEFANAESSTVNRSSDHSVPDPQPSTSANEPLRTNLSPGESFRTKKVLSDQLPTSPFIALLDASNIQFPLLLRKWKPGDYFYPLGMRKKKKLARFFIDQKLSATEKEKVWVLEMDKKILWVIGLRIDDRFRVTEYTRRVLKVEWLKS